MDAEDVVVDEGREGQAVEGRVDPLPDQRPELGAEAVLALPQKRPVAVVLLPAVDVARLVVPPQKPDLARLEALEGEEVGDDLQRAQAAVHVVAEEEEAPRRQRHPEFPDVVAEEVQVLQIPVRVAEDVGRRLEAQHPRLA